MLGERLGVGVAGHAQRLADPAEPVEVGADRVGRVGHRPERLDVGHGVARRRVDGASRRCAASSRERGRPGHRARSRSSRASTTWLAGVAALGVADDEVALEDRGVRLERAEQAADVGAAAGLVGDLVEPRHERGEPVDRDVAAERGLEGDLVADPLEAGRAGP